MYEKNNTKRVIIAGLLLALGVIIPMIFHSTGIAGTVFLPMHIPVLIGGFLLPPYLALFLGMITPLINSLITGMPIMFPIAIIMSFELGVYGLVASLLYRKLKLPSLIALILSMIAGRIMAGLVVFILATFFTLPMPLEPISFIIGSVTASIPGIIIQIILIPSLIHSIVRYTTINLD